MTTSPLMPKRRTVTVPAGTFDLSPLPGDEGTEPSWQLTASGGAEGVLRTFATAEAVGLWAAFWATPWGAVGSGSVSHIISDLETGLTFCGKLAALITDVTSEPEKPCGDCVLVRGALGSPATEAHAKGGDMPPTNRKTAASAAKKTSTAKKTTTAKKAAPAKKAVPARKAAPAAPVVLETLTFDGDAEAQAIIAEAGEALKEAAKANLEAGDKSRIAAEAGLKLRQRARNKFGAMDLRADSRAVRDATEGFVRASLGDADPDDPDQEDAYRSALRAYQNRSVDVVAEYVRSLDDENKADFQGDGFAVVRDHFDPTKEENKGLTASEAVWKYFEQLPGKGLPRHTRAEAARLDRARKKELEERVKSGELTAAEAEELGGDKAPLTDEQEALARIERARKNSNLVISGVAKLSNTSREKVRAAYDSLIAELAAARANI
ncbi:hypothetical protein OU787_17380 [Kitasatospora sp. YST-16]|uniref:hypothetical protein n=1 Tax=Kitasatospora sp. YST-16 TaxID=2998080 RepID=UPI002284F7CA|nr:hypothetical protein [Kitasatospora sp. YST-16]WAL73122.1 hypothetical protein OU787_17380 [Kitasatospora sp. YST-16]WNW39176.1 hypothetical protein RKE32_17345 [Streptomyces sp. Li-HN-5-13]